MDKKKKEFCKNLTIEILDAMLGTAEGMIDIVFDKKEAYKVISGTPERQWSVASISKFFDSLKRRGYLETVRSSTGESVRFTSKTKLALLDRIAEHKSIDGNFCFISFDIPETMRRNRNAFRRSIKRLGFMQIQKSLWVCNKSLGDLVEIASNEYEVDEYVVYIVGGKTNIDHTIFSKFSEK